MKNWLPLGIKQFRIVMDIANDFYVVQLITEQFAVLFYQREPPTVGVLAYPCAVAVFHAAGLSAPAFGRVSPVDVALVDVASVLVLQASELAYGVRVDDQTSPFEAHNVGIALGVLVVEVAEEPFSVSR